MPDSGVENVNAAVDATLLAERLHRVLAQVEVNESNSMIEAWRRSLKHQWLFLNSLDTIDRVRTLVAFFVDEHNTKMPHAAFRGQTPDEVFFGTALETEPLRSRGARSTLAQVLVERLERPTRWTGYSPAMSKAPAKIVSTSRTVPPPRTKRSPGPAAR
jgi:hypothetical protein